MTKTRQIDLLLIFFLLMFSFIVFKSCSNYFEFKKVVDTHQRINYSTINKTEHKGGRGDSYSLSVIYNQKKYDTYITRNDYDKKRLINLYYSEKKDIVFSMWEIERSRRLMIIFSIGIFIIFIVFIYRVLKSKNS